jgi:hypothetical protein
MARTRKTERRTYRKPHSLILVPLLLPRKRQSIVDILRRVHLLCDAKATAGKLPRTELFKAYNVSDSTGYRILKSKSPRRSDRITTQSRPKVSFGSI